MKLSVFYLLLLLLASCTNRNPYHCKIDPAVLSTNDSLMKTGYSDYLKNMKLPNLETFSDKSYRLTIFLAFDAGFHTYTLKQTNEGGVLKLKRTSTRWNRKRTDRINRSTMVSRTLNEQQWKKIEKAFNSNCFWTMPLLNERGLDGETYILEAFDADADNPVERKLVLVSRWSPDDGTGFKAICDEIEKLGETK